MRRFAIINEDAHVSVDASVQPPLPQPPQGRPQQTTGNVTAAVPAAALRERAAATAATSSAPAGAASAPAVEAAVPAAQRELMWLQRRYGSDFQPTQDSGDSDSGSTPHSRPLQQRPSTSSPDAQRQSWTLRLLPTDPAWARGHLRLAFSLAGNYPAAGSLDVTSQRSCPADHGGAAPDADSRASAATCGARASR